MRFIFVLSSLLLMYLFLLIKKIDKKQNIILWITLSIVLFMCYNSIIIFILSFINIPSFLIIRSIVSIMLALFLYIKLVRHKDRQQYSKVSIKDIIILVILLLIIIAIGIKRFGINMDISYETSDPAIHFLNAKYFYQESSLLERTNISDIYGKRSGASTMFFGYTNLGTLFQVMDFTVGVDYLYKLFNIFELFVLFISGYLFYLTIRKDKSCIFPAILSILYVLGYPLNNMLFGFHYLGLGVLLVNALILLFRIYYREKNINKALFKILIICVGLSLFTCYYLFIPFVFGGFGFYILYLWHVKKELKFKHALKDIVVLLFVPFIIGIFYYFILPRFIYQNGIDAMASDISSSFAAEGYIYRNLVGNFIFLFPIGVYELIKNLKNKTINVTDPILIFTSLITIGLFVLGCKEIISSYYFFKLYFLIWLLMFIVIGNNLNDKSIDHILPSTIIIIYVVLVIMSLCEVENTISNSSKYFNVTSSIYNITDIYRVNNSLLEKTVFTSNEIKKIYEIRNNPYYRSLRKDTLIFIGTINQRSWFYSLTDLVPSFYTKKFLYTFYYDMPFKTIDNVNTKYFILMKSYTDWTSTNKINKKYAKIDNVDSLELYYKKK